VQWSNIEQALDFSPICERHLWLDNQASGADAPASTIPLDIPEVGHTGGCGWSHSNLNQGNEMYTKIAMAGLLALMIGACGGGDEAAEAPPPAKEKASEVKSAKQSKAKKAKVKKAKSAKAATKK